MKASTNGKLTGLAVLVTGITDANSLAAAIARDVVAEGARVVCTGLGPTSQHAQLSERARAHLEATYESFRETVSQELGSDAIAIPCDVSQDESLEEVARELARREISIDGVVHAIARDPTIGRDGVLPLLQVSRKAFLDCMDVSAYSLIALLRALSEQDVLADGGSVVSLSYLGAERVVGHPYLNIGVAKAALERITIGLAHELGRTRGIRVNAVRFSPYTASRAGGAIPHLAEAADAAEKATALGNATGTDLAAEVSHLLRPRTRITGEIRSVDGGFGILGGAHHA